MGKYTVVAQNRFNLFMLQSCSDGIDQAQAWRGGTVNLLNKSEHELNQA
jgi:hypothetical protein